jgi:hypothetical protein
MIRRFRHRGLRRLYEDDDRRELNPQHADKIACTARGFWDTGLKLTQRWQQFEAACGDIDLA